VYSRYSLQDKAPVCILSAYLYRAQAYRAARMRTCKIIILPVVLYECETWSLVLREEHRLRVFENRVLRILGPRRDEVTGGWIKLHN
jgi:hypothetical protein